MTTDAPQLTENQYGDQYDRYSDAGYAPDQYYAQFLPERRYLDYIEDYLVMTAAIQDGTLDEISDESIMRLAWAPKDSEAIKYGESRAHANGDDRALFDMVFGDGYTKVQGLEKLDIPRINPDDPQDYQDKMTAKLGGDSYFSVSPMDQNTFYPHNRSTLGKIDSRVRRFALGMLGNDVQPGAENLFSQASSESRPRESFGADLYDAAGSVAAVGTDLYVGGRAGIPVIKAGAAVAAKTARGVAGAATAAGAAPTIVALLQKIANSGVTGRQARIATQLGLFTASAGTAAYSRIRGLIDDTGQYGRERLGDIRTSGLTQEDKSFMESPNAYSYLNPLARDARKTGEDIGAPETMTRTGSGEWEADYGPR